MQINADEAAAGYKEELIKYRRHLHRHPELSFKEYETSAYVKEHLKKLNIPVLEGVSGNSVVGVLKGNKPGPCLLFRADMDALPVEEKTGLPFASVNPGVMHACGHDAHTAVMMCFAEFLAEHPELICGTVKLVFQQGEELVPGGGSLIVEDGVLDDVDNVFAWHCSPENDIGRVIASEGPRMSSFDNFEIIIKGHGGHSAFPQLSSDVATVAALIIMAYNALAMHTADPMDPVTMTISNIESGRHGIYNIIPDQARIEGNIRSLDNAAAQKILDRVEKTALSICAANECECEFIRHKGYPALINDLELTPRLREALIAGGIDARKSEPIMASEDFAFYTLKRPGTYFNVGTKNPADENTMYPAHNSFFRIDESALTLALKTFILTYMYMTGQQDG